MEIADLFRIKLRRIPDLWFIIVIIHRIYTLAKEYGPVKREFMNAM